MTRLVYRFPIPPSGNHSTGSNNGQRYTVPKVKNFREEVFIEALKQRGRIPAISEPVGLTFVMPSIRGDLTNRLKTMEDAITRAGIWNDDKQVRAQNNFYDPALPKDRCVVVINDLPGHWAEVEQLARQMQEAR